MKLFGCHMIVISSFFIVFQRLQVIANLAGCEMTSSAIVNCLRKKTEKEIVSVTTEALKVRENC